MAVHIRLKRQGRRKRPFYRVIAIDSRSHREGREIERLGWYDPIKEGLSVEHVREQAAASGHGPASGGQWPPAAEAGG